MTKQIDEIMEQAQVFASAWSLVGGRFDGGNAMDDAEVAKNELRQMVAEALAEQPAQKEPVGYVVENGLVDWNVCAPPILTDLYTASPPRRKPLTDEQIAEACGWKAEMGCKPLPRELRIARAIEAAHGIKENI